MVFQVQNESKKVLKVAFFIMPKLQKFAIEPNGFSHVIGKCLMRVLRVVSDMTGNARKTGSKPKKVLTTR